MVDEERTRRTPVAPLTDVSIGKVTSCSTSSGAIPCASVMTTTVGAFKSGKTSTSVLSVMYVPPINRRIAEKRITKRLWSEK